MMTAGNLEITMKLVFHTGGAMGFPFQSSSSPHPQTLLILQYTMYFELLFHPNGIRFPTILYKYAPLIQVYVDDTCKD